MLYAMLLVASPSTSLGMAHFFLSLLLGAVLGDTSVGGVFRAVGALVPKPGYRVFPWPAATSVLPHALRKWQAPRSNGGKPYRS